MLSTMTGMRPDIGYQIVTHQFWSRVATIRIQFEKPVFLLLIGHDVTVNKSVEISCA